MYRDLGYHNKLSGIRNTRLKPDNQVLKLGENCLRSGHENTGNETKLERNNCNSLLNNSDLVTELEPHEIMVT